MELKSGESTLIQNLAAPDAATLAHTADEHAICCFDGRTLALAAIVRPHVREIYELPAGWERGTGFGFAEDGLFATFVETDGSTWRLRLIGVPRPSQATVAEAKEEIADPMPRPKRSGLLFRQHNGLWLVNYDGKNRGAETGGQWRHRSSHVVRRRTNGFIPLLSGRPHQASPAPRTYARYE